MSEPLRIGLLGASRIAELAVTEASRGTGDIRAAVAARDPERARAYAEEHGYDGIRDDYEQLVADDTLDLVYIGLPNGLHAEWTVRALAAGRSVLVEKPFASNLAEFDAVVARMEHAEGWAWEAFHYADHPAIGRVLDLIRSGELGELREIEVHMQMPDPGAADPRCNFDLAGGAMMDVGCYAINVLLLLGEALGREVELLWAEADPYVGDARIDATVRGRLSLGEIPVVLRASMVHPEFDFSLRVRGSLGEALLPNFVKPQEDDRLIVRSGSGSEAEERVEHVGTVSSYTYQLNRVRDELRAGARPQRELERSRRTMQLIDEIYLASGLPLRQGSLGAAG